MYKALSGLAAGRSRQIRMLMPTAPFIHTRITTVKYLIWPTLILLLIACGCSRSSKPGTFTNAIGTTPTPAPTLPAGVKPDYTVEVENSDGGLVVHVIFSGILPAPEEVDKIVRTEFEKVIKKNPSVDASTLASGRDCCLTLNDYSGDLYYKAATKSILTEDEFRGVKISTETTDLYVVETAEIIVPDETAPPKTRLLMTLVFPQIPPQNVAYESLVREIDKARPRGLDILAYVYAGDKNKKTSWYQVMGPDGGPIWADYNTLTDQIMTGLTVLKTYPRENRK